VQKRSEKEQVVAELHDKLARAKVAIVAQPNKIDVATITDLRKQFRDQKIEYKVVKNTLAKRAAKGTAAEALSNLFEGPTALVMGFDDPVAPAKVLQGFISKKAELMSVRGAVVDGRAVDAKAVADLAKLPGINELRAQLMGMLNRPAQMLASIVNQPGSSLARVVKARQEAENKS